MADGKDESNERQGPLKNGEEETKKPLFDDKEEYTNSRHYIVTKTRPKNMSIERFTYDWLKISYFEFFVSNILCYFFHLNFNFSFYTHIVHGMQNMLVYFKMFI